MRWPHGPGRKAMKNLTFAKVSDALFSAAPEFRELYERELSWWQGPEPPGNYVIFGFLVQPALRDLLGTREDPSLLKRLFDFFEEMANSSDIEVVNLLQVGVFEWLISDVDKLAAAWKYMGEETKAIARETARIWRREDNLPQDR